MRWMILDSSGVSGASLWYFMDFDLIEVTCELLSTAAVASKRNLRGNYRCDSCDFCISEFHNRMDYLILYGLRKVIRRG